MVEFKEKEQFMFKRQLTGKVLTSLISTSLWKNKLKKDCLNQNVFLAIRDDRVDFYHKGGKLFSFKGKKFLTHIKYAAVISKNGKDYLTESQLKNHKISSNFDSNYERIKENCSLYSGVEALGVSHLYHKYSYLSKSEIVVLDIEISLKSQDKVHSQDRIDILLYNKKENKLQFVEAKHYSNSELWSNSTPKVINQISKYEKQISNPATRTQILQAYSTYIGVINQLFKKNTIPTPNNLTLDSKVTLYIFGFDANQRSGRLQDLIMKNPKYKGRKVYCKGDEKNQLKPSALWNAKIL